MMTASRRFSKMLMSPSCARSRAVAVSHKRDATTTCRRGVAPSRLFAVAVVVVAATTTASSSSFAMVSATSSFSSSSSSTSSAFSSTRPPIVVSSGLQNLGNTCYLNAQLQCAFHIPLVRQLIIQPPKSQATNDNEHQEEGDSLVSASSKQSGSVALRALRQLFTDMERNAFSPLSDSSCDPSSTGRITSTRQFCSALGIPVLEQQDTQEFWKLLLPALQLPVLTDLYQGSYEDYIVALDESKRERRREEAFLDLSLDVSSTLSSVEQALAKQFSEPELLSSAEGNGWRPEKGADKVDAHKGTLLRAPGLPSILQLHLKRFQFDWTTETTSKINDPCTFPTVLDLSDLCQDSSISSSTDANDKSNKHHLLYDLQAVVVHAGKFGEGGHYYAYVRPDVQSDVWYRFNDHVVEQVDIKEVLCDSYGGKSIQPMEPPRTSTKKGIWARLLSVFKCSEGESSYGYGGPTSNAYVLQYIRRSDIPLLYLCKGE